MQKIRFSLLLLLIVFLHLLTEAQLIPCGTVIIQKQEKQYSNNSPIAYQDTILRCVTLQVHIIRKSDGSGGFPVNDLIKEIDTVNYFFKNANIRFVLKNNINYIDKDNYHDTINGNEHTIIYNAYHVTNVINVFISPGLMACGLGYLPGGFDCVFLNNFCAANGSTFTHELGHYFNLYHTHETYYGIEWVNGSNCSTAGDLICDTPADPNLFTKVNGSCIYTGVNVDPNGTPYNPETRNILSYSVQFCRDLLTTGQYTRMYNCLINDRYYLDIDTCSQITSAENNDSENAITIYPNPATKYVYIKYNIPDNYTISLNLFNICGQTIYKDEFNLSDRIQGTYTIYLDNQLKGVYFYQLNNSQKIVKQGKLIIQ